MYNCTVCLIRCACFLFTEMTSFVSSVMVQTLLALLQTSVVHTAHPKSAFHYFSQAPAQDLHPTAKLPRQNTVSTLSGNPTNSLTGFATHHSTSDIIEYMLAEEQNIGVRFVEKSMKPQPNRVNTWNELRSLISKVMGQTAQLKQDVSTVYESRSTTSHKEEKRLQGSPFHRRTFRSDLGKRSIGTSGKREKVSLTSS